MARRRRMISLAASIGSLTSLAAAQAAHPAASASPAPAHAAAAPSAAATHPAPTQSGSGSQARTQPAAAPTGPHLIAPMAEARVTSHRPTLRWAGVDAEIDLCRDRACTDLIATVQGHAGSAQPTADLAPGRVFWRVRTGGTTSAVWHFYVGPRSATVDSSWASTFDANGDGLADVIARGADAVAIYLGATAGVSAQPAVTVQAPREAVGFGFAAAPAGDVNGDGYGDLIIGTFSSDKAYVYLGTATGVALTPAATLSGPANSAFGFSVAGAGDVNGDGYADVVVGAPTGGRAFVYFGTATGMRGDPAGSLTGPTGSFRYGYSVAGIGDVNADGRGDVVVGSLGNAAYVYLGEVTGLPASPTTPLPSAAADYGSSVASAGDVNGDGYADLLIGATGSNAAYVFSGGASGLVTDHPATVFGAANTWTGFSVASAGDVNGDGFADVVLATGGTTALVYSGAQTGLVVNAAAATLTIGQAGEYALAAFNGGDVNGDGFADAVVATRANNTTQVFLGAASGVSTTAAATLRGPAPRVQASAAPSGTPLNTDRDDQ